ncbi:LutC/YkgG family protein [Frateuria aurantia]
MSSRESILATIRAAGRMATQRPVVPSFDQHHPAALERFQTSLELIGGRWRAPDPDLLELAPWIRQLFPDGSRFCSAVPEMASDVELPSAREPTRLASVDVGVVRARFGIAETGSLWLSEAEYQVNALGYLPQHLVVLLDPEALVGNLHHAYQREDFRQARYCVLMSGPSATADIEGVLIRGAQGVRSLTVIPWPRPDRAAGRPA